MNKKYEVPKDDHIKMIYEYKERVKKIGYFIWLIVLIIGVLGVFYFKWYIAVSSAGIVLVASFLFSYLQAVKIKKITGLSIKEQEYCYKKTRHFFNHEAD